MHQAFKLLFSLFLGLLIMVPVSSWTAPSSSSPEVAAAARVQSVGATAKIDLNKATREDLTTVPGIGPKLAKTIVELRTKKGSFNRVEDLLEVRGIGEKNLKRFAEYVYVAQPATSGGATKTSETK